MATLTIRDLPEDTRQALKARAARHSRSVEAEVRDNLQTTVAPAITATELRYGVARLPAGKRRAELDAAVERLITGADKRLLTFDDTGLVVHDPWQY